MSQQPILYPEDRIPLGKLVPMAMQHVVAMFGATILAPRLMHFDPQVAIFFSGIGTLLFIVITGFKVPSYLGSSFAFIGPVLAVTGGKADLVPAALCGIAGAAALYAVAAVATMRYGAGWIDRLMPPVVTGTVVAIIGLNLAGASVKDALNATLTVACMQDVKNLVVATITFLSAAAVAVYFRGFLRLLPVLIGVIVGCSVAILMGVIDEGRVLAIAGAPLFGRPRFVTPCFSWEAILVIAPVFVVLVAENKGHIAAISGYMGRDLSPWLGRAYLGDAVATFISALGGGTPQTTYAENMGVMAITRVFAIANFIGAAAIAILFGVCPKFGALIQAIPGPVLGGVTLILYGLITLMGVKIWLDARVDFSDARNLVVAGASLILATGLGLTGVTVGSMNVSGIALGTVFALVLNLLVSIGREGPPTGPIAPIAPDGNV
ncbi:MAG: pyrimidine utilization transport protein G [Candidatus Riflebacteria bacterium]|nr:pyrimidine utilization transport protein G [Candidatus Riflebacteria bacterium]